MCCLSWADRVGTKGKSIIEFLGAGADEFVWWEVAELRYGFLFIPREPNSQPLKFKVHFSPHTVSALYEFTHSEYIESLFTERQKRLVSECFLSSRVPPLPPNHSYLFTTLFPLTTILTCFLYQSLELRLQQQHCSSCLLLATRAFLANNVNRVRRGRAGACEVVSWPLWCSSFSSAEETSHFKTLNFSLNFCKRLLGDAFERGEVLILRMKLLGIPRLFAQFLIVLFSSLRLSSRVKRSWAAVDSLDLLRKGSNPFWPLFCIYAFELRIDY